MACCGSNVVCPGAQQAYQYTNQPVYTAQADCSNRYSQQLVDNRTDIYINQPIINNRDHHINHVNSQLIRDNNFYHYHTQNLFRDNVINHYQNRVFRQQNNFSDYSCSYGVLPGTISNVNHGTCFFNLGATWSLGCAAAAPISCCC